MRVLKIALIAVALLFSASAASAAGWTKTKAGSEACTTLKRGEVCWVATGGAATSAIHVEQCEKWKLMIWGTGVTVMPQECDDGDCGTVEALLKNALTGDAPNTFAHSQVPIVFLRLSTTDSVTASIQCSE